MIISHRPVLLQETLQLLKPNQSESFFIDCTLGEGGHTEAFLQAYPHVRAAGIDADAEIQKKARERLLPFSSRMLFFNSWADDFFSSYPSDLPNPDIILCDLGISSFHYAESGRGFSFQKNEPLDMRLNAQTSVLAADIVNNYSEKELANVIFLYGEERYSRRIARALVERRRTAPFLFASELAEAVFGAVPAAYRHGHLHPATKTFQALRIAVNSELDRLPRLLAMAFERLQPRGKLGVISFHSLEDRIVKQYFRNLAKRCTCPPEMPICRCGGRPQAVLVVKKPVCASSAEIQENAPSRSARLRVVQKIYYEDGAA